jgi:hypothetical protein
LRKAGLKKGFQHLVVVLVVVLTSSFLLYMPVFAALAGGKVTLYRPLQAPAGGKVATAGGKVAVAGGKVAAAGYFTAR